MLVPSGGESVIVFVHPGYRKRLDSLRQVQLCGSSHTSETPARAATRPLSSTFTLRSLFGSGVAGDSPIGGSGDLRLVGLAGVVSQGSGGVEDAAALEDDGAPPGSGIDVSSTSLRGVFAALSSSGSSV